MISLKKVCLIGTLMLSMLPFVASAQSAQGTQATTTSSKAVLIADVNITVNNLRVTDGVVSGSFSAMSSYGNQDNVAYGFILRSTKTGELVFVSPILGTLSLPEKVAKNQSVDYQLPGYLAEDSEVFLNLSNSSGIVLATVKVGEVKGTLMDAVCDITDTSVKCTPRTDSVLSFSVYEGGAQGMLIGTTSLDLKQKVSVSTLFVDIIKNLGGGRYLITGVVSSQGKEYQQFAKEYEKPGTVTKILSVSIPPVTEQKGGFEGVVYTRILGASTSTSYTLAINAGSCGRVDNVPVSKDNVTKLTLQTTCENGNAVVTLFEGDKAVDQVTSTFSLPPSVVPETSPNKNLGLIATIVAIALLAIALIVLFTRNKGAGSVPTSQSGNPTPTPTSMTNINPNPVTAPSSAPASGVTAALVLLALFITFSPTQASAATVSLSQVVEVSFWPGGIGGQSEEGGAFSGDATITYPSSVSANSIYTVSVSQLNGPGGAATAGCQDTSVDGWGCDVADVQTTFYIDGATWTSASHVTSGSYTRTAPASGSITFFGRLNIWAPYYFGCDPYWSNKCTLNYDNANNSTGNIIIPVVGATPTVDVRFSLLEKMFAVFAAN